jgi:hypothetical protein
MLGNGGDAEAGGWCGFDAWDGRWEDAPEGYEVVEWEEQTEAWKEERLRRRKEREAEEEKLWPCPLFAPRHKSDSGGEVDHSEALPLLVGDAQPGDEIAFQMAELSAAWEPCLVWRTATVLRSEQGQLTLQVRAGDGQETAEMVEQQAHLTGVRLVRRCGGGDSAAEQPVASARATADDRSGHAHGDVSSRPATTEAGGGSGRGVARPAQQELPRRASRSKRRRSREANGDAATQAPQLATDDAPKAATTTEAIPVAAGGGGAYSRRRSAARQVDYYFSQARALAQGGSAY